MKTLHGWVIVDTRNSKMVHATINRKEARKSKRIGYKGRNYAIRKFEVIEPAPRRKKPVMMICPKAENGKCKGDCRHSPKHAFIPGHGECRFNGSNCPACVEAK